MRVCTILCMHFVWIQPPWVEFGNPCLIAPSLGSSVMVTVATFLPKTSVHTVEICRGPSQILAESHTCIHMGMDQYLLIPFLGEWTSIYQLFWGSPGVPGFWHTATSLEKTYRLFSHHDAQRSSVSNRLHDGVWRTSWSHGPCYVMQVCEALVDAHGY